MWPKVSKFIELKMVNRRTSQDNCNICSIGIIQSREPRREISMRDYSSFGNMLFYSGKPSASRRCQLFVDSNCKALLAWELVSDKFLTARFRFRLRSIMFVQCCITGKFLYSGGESFLRAIASSSGEVKVIL